MAQPVTGGEAIAMTLGATLLFASIISVALAQLGALRPLTFLASLVAVGLTGGAATRVGSMRIPRPTAVEIAAIAGVIIAAGLLYFPGFPYAVVDKDPGGYVNHAAVIAREGSSSFDDPIAVRVAELDGAVMISERSPGARFAGFWQNPEDPTVVTPQFYHVLPSLMAALMQLSGRTSAAFHLNIAIAATGGLLLLFATRRAFGWVAAVVATSLLTTNMMQVWQAKMPTTEVLFQALVLLAILAASISFACRLRSAAAIAGLAVGTTFLVRPDGLLTVLMAIGGLAVIVSLGMADKRAAWFAAGLVPVSIYATYNAYGPLAHYTVSNDIPSLRSMLALLAAVAIATVALRAVYPRLGSQIPDALNRTSFHRAVGSHLTLLTLAAMLALYHRSTLFGDATFDYNGRVARSLDEMNLVRLSWFFSGIGLLAAAGGLMLVSRDRWHPVRWMLLIPGLATFPLYAWEAKISPRLMWWTRRYVPLVIVVIVVLIGVLIGWLIMRNGRFTAVGTVAGLALWVFLVGFGLNQSLPLRDHREWTGTLGFSERIVQSAGDDGGLFLWTYPTGTDLYQPSRTLAVTAWTLHDRLVAYGATEDDDPQAFVDAYASAFPAEPLLIVGEGTDLPPGLDATRFEWVARHELVTSVWEETWDPGDQFRPTKATAVEYEVSVWRLNGSPASTSGP